MHLPQDFLAAVTLREDPRDCLVSNSIASLEGLVRGASWHSSLRREAQSGSVTLRCRSGPFAATSIRAWRSSTAASARRSCSPAAGLKRPGPCHPHSVDARAQQSLPAPGGRAADRMPEDRALLRRHLARWRTPPRAACVHAERALTALSRGLPAPARGLRCSGRTPRSACAPGGTPAAAALCVRKREARCHSGKKLGETLAASMRAQGADAILASLS